MSQAVLGAEEGRSVFKPARAAQTDRPCSPPQKMNLINDNVDLS